MKTLSLRAFQVMALSVLFAACGGAEPDVAETTPEPTPEAEVQEEAPTELGTLRITEHTCGPVHMSHAHHEAKRAGNDPATLDHTQPYTSVHKDDLTAGLAEEGLTPMEPREVTTPIGPPVHVIVEEEVAMSETRTLVAFEKNGVEVMQVTYDPLDPDHVEHVAFTHKGHTDEYDVHPGMKGREVRKMRRELKHMEHKGVVFLYDDQSNIAYRMTAIEPGTEVTVEVVEQLEVEAIVWRNKHHKKDKA